jgi:MFS transporter, FSR family, fosmidomycin resistance protein
VMGIGNTVYHPADYALLSRHVAAERVSQAYSVHTFAGLLGGAAAPGTLLFMHSLFGWRGAMLGAATLGFAVAALLLLQGDPATAQPTSKLRDNSKGEAPDNSWRLLLSAPILMSLLFFMLLAFGNFGLQSFLVVALGTLHGTSPAIANTALSAYLAFGAAGVLLGGWIAGRTHRHALVAALGLLGTALAALLVGAADVGPVPLVTVMAIAGLCTGTIMPSRDMIVREVTPPGSFGKVFGFVTNGFHVAGIISPLVFGALMDHGEAQLVFVLLAACSVLAMLTIVSVPRRRAASGALARG